MKKFEEEVKGKAATMATQPGCSMTRKVWYKADDIHELSEGWVSPETFELEENTVKQLFNENKQLKSQIEKQQPEIPEFVAEFITKLKKANNDLTFAFSSRVNECPAKYWNEAIVWRFNHPEEFAQAWINGYTVKQKRFYLKHIDFCKRDKYYDRYIIKYDSGVLNHLRIEKGVLPQNVDTYFTQQEIDSMETGSYEQIEVEE